MRILKYFSREEVPRPEILFAMIAVFLFTQVPLVNAQTALPFPPTIDLSSLDGTGGLVINGVAEGGQSPLNASSAGDINGDGIADIVIGAPNANVNGTTDAGQSYVVFGTDQGFPNPLELSSLGGANGFIINGIYRGDLSGTSISAAGDVNADTFDDLIIGAWKASPDGRSLAGQSYVVLGTDQPFPPVLELSALDGGNGFTINGITETDFAGISVSAAGDVNRDGFGDLIIGANGVDRNGLFNVGQAYVVFGTDQGFPNPLELSSLGGANGFSVNGEGLAAFDNTGLSVSSGDVNGDDFGDIIVGAPSAAVANRDTRGRAYVMLGTDQGFPAELELAALDGANGVVINGVAEGDFAGKSVSSADVNGDGFDDVIIGANGASPNGIPSAGQTHVVFGTDQGFPAMLELSDLDGANGFILNGIAEDDFSGIRVSSAGDLNDDGIDDIVIGAPFASFNENPLAGQGYVVFGTDQGFPPALDLSSLDGSNGLTLNGSVENGRSGWSVSAAGDVNGDGVGDVVVGSNFSDLIDPDEPGLSQAYVVFGRQGNSASDGVIYVSTRSSGTVGGLSVGDEDIVAHDVSTGTISMFLDMSDVDVSADVNAFHVDTDGSILLSFNEAARIPGVGLVDHSDIVRFTPSSTGSDTVGTFALFFDGKDVGLLAEDKDSNIDAIGFAPDGRLIISTRGGVTVPGAKCSDEDLLAFTATALGPSTSGSFEKYFDGSDVGLKDGGNNEDVSGASIDDNGAIYLTTKGAFAVSGASGDGADIFTCVSGSAGSNTSCAFSLYFDGSENGLGGIDGFDIAG